MIPRLLKLPLDQSLFLFGPRNTGKSTLIKHFFTPEMALYLDLLNPDLEQKFALNPNELKAIVEALPDKISHIIIDEVQKIPKLLDVVHYLIESTDKKFILTGSSARKLKHGGANLLAGRAFVYNLYTFNYIEIRSKFNLNDALAWGMLPKIFEFDSADSKQKFLQAYTHTYLKEEIWAEQFIRNLDPFRRFIEVAAQMNGKIINFSKISRDVGVDDKTIKNYYSILEDTLIGFFLGGFQNSFRKRLSIKPKFYLFDMGVQRALSRTLSIPMNPGTSVYGDTFEHFIILECIKMASYYNSEFKFSYLKTKDDLEIDLVVERPGKPLLLIEIKSTNNITSESLSSLMKVIKDHPDAEAVCLCNEPFAKKIDSVNILPWQQGIQQLFG